MSQIERVGVTRDTGTDSHKLVRQLGLRDLVLTQIMSVVGSGWVGIAAGLGRAQAVVWLSAMAIFYVPMAVSVYFLNREMPLEGGLYVWARTAFGDTLGFMTAWNLWAYALGTVAVILFEIPTLLTYLVGPSLAWLPENHFAVLCVTAALLAGLSLSSWRGLALGKWFHGIGGTAQMVAYALLIGMPFVALARHQPIHFVPLALHAPALDMKTIALMGEMFGALCGLEYIAITAGETRAPGRSIGQSVLISSPVICFMFIFGTGSVLAFHELNPGTSINYIAPIPQTLRLAIGSQGLGNLVAIVAILLLTLRVLGAASFIFTGVVRLPMVAGWDHLIPARFSRLDPRYQTPANSILLTSVIVFGLMILGSLGVKAAEAFQVLVNCSAQLYALTYLVMFAIPILGATALRRRLPRWVAWTSGLGFLATLFSLFVTSYPFVDVVDPRAYAAKIIGTVALTNVAGYLFYRVRRGAVRSGVHAEALG